VLIITHSFTLFEIPLAELNNLFVCNANDGDAEAFQLPSRYRRLDDLQQVLLLFVS
jgi:hypothetical protein